MPKSSTSTVITLGRVFYALSILCFGIQYAINGHLLPGLPLCPAWLPNGHILTYILAAIFIATGLALLSAWRTTTVGLILGLLLLVSAFFYFQHTNYILHNGDGRTLILECLAIAAAALILHGLSTGNHGKLSMMPGRILFAFTMIVFGAQHFMYTRFIATLIPAFIPYHVFWIEFTGIALIAAGASIATTIADKIASWCLFVLFFGWLVLLHIPRVTHALRNMDEWSSALVVLAMCGASLLCVASSEQTR